jgi:hypothetical protein
VPKNYEFIAYLPGEQLIQDSDQFFSGALVGEGGETANVSEKNAAKRNLLNRGEQNCRNNKVNIKRFDRKFC